MLNPQKGFIGYLILIVFLLLILGTGSFYYLQSNKASSANLSTAKDSSDYKINPVYVTLSTNGWKDYQYKNVKIKYPTDWVVKPFNLGDGDRVGFSNSKDTTIIFTSLEGSEQFSSCEDFLNKIVKQPGSESAEPMIPLKSLEFDNFSAQSSSSSVSAGGVSAQETRICFDKNNIKYGVSLNNPDSKEVILMLNSLSFTQ